MMQEQIFSALGDYLSDCSKRVIRDKHKFAKISSVEAKLDLGRNEKDIINC